MNTALHAVLPAPVMSVMDEALPLEDGLILPSGPEGMPPAADSAPPSTPAQDDAPEIGCGFGEALEMPLHLRNPGHATLVWNHWYGNARQVSRVMESLLRVRAPQTSAFARNAMRSSPALVVSMLLGNPPLAAALLQQLPAAERQQIDPGRRLDGQLRQLLGAAHDELARTCREATAVELARRIEACWPCMAWLHEQGAYLPTAGETLLQLGWLHERLQEGHWSALERGRALLAVSLLLQRLPPHLSALLGIHAAPFRECVARPFRFFGLDSDSLDPARPVWEQVDERAAAATLAGLRAWAESLPAAAGVLEPLRQLEPRLVQQASLPRTLASLYQRFCTEHAGPRYTRLREAFARYSAALEIELDAAALPAQLVGRALPVERIADHAALQQRLRALIDAEAQCIDIPGLLAASQQRLDRLQAIHAEILALGQTPSVSGLLKIAELAESARQDILANRDWFAGSLAATRPYVALWEGFHADIEQLQRQPAAERRSEQREQKAARVTVEAAAPARSDESPLVLQLRQTLQDERHASAQLREELKASRTEQHRLQCMAEAVGALTPRSAAPLVDSSLLRRVVNARDSLSPAEVLALFSELAGTRLVVLDSAWRSAAGYPGRFAGTERLFDLLDRLLFPYLDALNAGTPDSQARNIFGAKAYSAKESDATLSDARLRALREFPWQGGKRLFERHLRIGNQTGLEGMRLYFDIIDRQVVIAYLGPHLQVSSSN